MESPGFVGSVWRAWFALGRKAEVPMTYISFVMVSRNDDYGGNLRHRMQTCLDSIVSLADRYEVPTEVQLVEWNPPKDSPPLEEILEFPDETATTDVNFLTVPPDVHDALPGSDSLPLFEYIGKNVGIRRASGEFVLSANPDLIFNEKFFEFLASQRLSHEKFYRIRKYNLGSLVPIDANIDAQLEFCQQNVTAKYTPHGYREIPYTRRIRNVAHSYLTVLRNPWHIVDRVRRLWDPRPRSIYDLHHLAAGDFILMGKEEWEMVNGHPEFEYNFHVDSYSVLAAAAAGLEEHVFDDAIRVYHQPHEDQHDERPRGEWSELVDLSREALPNNDDVIGFNDKSWGLPDEEITERTLVTGSNPVPD